MVDGLLSAFPICLLLFFILFFLCYSNFYQTCNTETSIINQPTNQPNVMPTVQVWGLRHLSNFTIFYLTFLSFFLSFFLFLSGDMHLSCFLVGAFDHVVSFQHMVYLTLGGKTLVREHDLHRSSQVPTIETFNATQTLQYHSNISLLSLFITSSLSVWCTVAFQHL